MRGERTVRCCPGTLVCSDAYCCTSPGTATLGAMDVQPYPRRGRPGWTGRLSAALAVMLTFMLVGADWWLSAPSDVGSYGSDDVKVIAGGIHAVRHSVRPLPSPDNPRPDGLPTLVQFAATWCEVCHAMEPVMAHIRRTTEGRLVVVEKDVDSEMGLVRLYRVVGTPTFIVLDAQGREIGRPRLIIDPDRFLAEVERIVAGSRG
jgi:thiol-disulfide isomerase/thioredoxin